MAAFERDTVPPGPFSQYQVDPAHIEAMHSAFHRVCEALLLKCDKEAPMTEVIAGKILSPASTGLAAMQRVCIF